MPSANHRRSRPARCRSPTASATCAGARCWRGSIRPSCWRSPCASPARCSFDLGSLKYTLSARAGAGPHAHQLRCADRGGLVWRSAGALAKVRAAGRARAGADRRAGYEAFFPHRATTSCATRARARSCQAAARRPIPRCATAWGITEVDPARMNMLFDASSPGSAELPTSTSTSSTSAASDPVCLRQSTVASARRWRRR